MLESIATILYPITYGETIFLFIQEIERNLIIEHHCKFYILKMYIYKSKNRSKNIDFQILDFQTFFDKKQERRCRHHGTAPAGLALLSINITGDFYKQTLRSYIVR